MASPSTINVLFFGDLVGQSGRVAARHYLSNLSTLPDIVIANSENVTHGFGLNERHYYELREMGIHLLTGGNHTWDRKELLEFIKTAECIVRPANFPNSLPGEGAKVFKVNGVKIGVINLMGQVFMGNYNSPWESFDRLLPELQRETPIIFVDFHAEATAEKVAFAHYAAERGVSILVGTHTHVQTADEKILLERMGYITDVGFNGAYDSVIGMERHGSTERLRTLIPNKLDVAVSDHIQINAVQFNVDQTSGICREVTRINQHFRL